MDFMRGFIPKSLKILQNQNRSKAPGYEPRLRINRSLNKYSFLNRKGAEGEKGRTPHKARDSVLSE
jgi:hypothetical protein